MVDPTRSDLFEGLENLLTFVEESGALNGHEYLDEEHPVTVAQRLVGRVPEPAR